MRAVRLGLGLACLLYGGEEMATIPSGEFTMGRTKLTADDKTAMRPNVLLDDIPARKVAISGFQLDRYEVTNKRYSQFLSATKRQAPRHWMYGAFPPAIA